MKTNFHKLPGSQIELEVALNKEEFNGYWQPVYEDALNSITIKGFRQGAAPRSLAEQAVDKERVFGEVANRAIHATLEGLRSEHEWVFIDSPKVEILEAASLESKQADISLKYRATLTLFPEITLGDYKKAAQRALAERRDITVGDAEVEETLKWIRGSRAKITLVDRGAANGDLIEISMRTSDGGTPSTKDEFKEESLILGENRHLPGFDEKLIGRRASETLNFSLVMPDAHPDPNLRNRKMDFEVKIKAVFNRELPEADDAFAGVLGPNLKTIADARKNIADGLRFEKENKEKDRIRAKMLEEIISASKADIPKILLDKTLDGLIQEARQTGGANQTDDLGLREKLAQRARSKVMSHLVIYGIAKKERLEPKDEELSAEAEAGRLDREKFHDYIYSVVQNRKVFEFLEKQ